MRRLLAVCGRANSPLCCWGGKDIWPRYFEQYDAANFGIGGDKTQHLLWGIENGELDGISPQVVVVMIGTNNIGASAANIVKANQKIVSEIHRRLPASKVLLLGLLPRGAGRNNPMRAKIQAINAELARFDDGRQTRFLDFGARLLEADGSISPETMPDALHPTARGYQIWADAMQPLLDEMMLGYVSRAPHNPAQ